MTHKLIHTPDYLLVVDDSGTRIAHLPLNYSPILEGVPLLPSLEQEDKELYYQKQVMQPYSVESQSYTSYENGFIDGYNKAKEKYKYTEEDLRKAIDMAQEQERVTYTEDYRHTFNADEIIQSLSQPNMPVGFECETITMNKGYTDEKDYPYQECEIPKTTTNSQGQTVWVGKYIFPE
jgi:hypothetical protein